MHTLRCLSFPVAGFSSTVNTEPNTLWNNSTFRTKLSASSNSSLVTPDVLATLYLLHGGDASTIHCKWEVVNSSLKGLYTIKRTYTYAETCYADISWSWSFINNHSIQIWFKSANVVTFLQGNLSLSALTSASFQLLMSVWSSGLYILPLEELAIAM